MDEARPLHASVDCQAILEAMNQGFGLAELVRDDAGRPTDVRLTFANAAFETQTGLPLHDVLGRLLSEVLSGPDFDWWLPIFTGLVGTSEPVRLIHRVEKLGRWFDVSIIPRERDRFAVLFDDVSDRKRADDLLRQTEARQRFLLHLNDRLRSLDSAAAILYEAARAIGEHLHAARAGYGEDQGDGRSVRVLRHYTDGVLEVEGSHCYEDYGRDVVPEFLAGHTLVRSDVANDPTLTDAEKAAYAALQVGAAVNVPLVKAGRLVAVLFLHRRQAHAWTDDEVALLEEVGQRTWSAVERARAENALRQAHDQLEQRVRERTSKIEALFKQVVTIQEDERRRIARDIHDHLGQQMTALRMSLESLRQRLAGDPASADQAARAIQLAVELDHSIDFLTWGLRPAALDHLGLAAALNHLAHGWSERLGIEVEFDATGAEDLRLPAEWETHLYRIAQEALHNVYKYARASHVTLSLVRRDQRVTLIVEDNGCGFDTEDAQGGRGGAGGLGLIGIRERAMLFGGEVVVESSPGQGTTVFVRLPVPGPSRRPATDSQLLHEN